MSLVAQQNAVVEFVFELRDEAGIVDVSGADTMTLRFKDPDDTAVDKTLTHVTDGTDGQVKYKAAKNELDTKGEWAFQVIVEDGTDYWVWPVHHLRILENL